MARCVTELEGVARADVATGGAAGADDGTGGGTGARADRAGARPAATDGWPSYTGAGAAGADVAAGTLIVPAALTDGGAERGPGTGPATAGEPLADTTAAAPATANASMPIIASWPGREPRRDCAGSRTGTGARYRGNGAVDASALDLAPNGAASSGGIATGSATTTGIDGNVASTASSGAVTPSVPVVSICRVASSIGSTSYEMLTVVMPATALRHADTAAGSSSRVQSSRLPCAAPKSK